MSFKNDNQMKRWCFVADYQATSLRPANGTQVDRTNIPAGTVVMVDAQNKVVDTMPATGFVKFVYGLSNGQNPIETPLMDVTKMTITKKKYVAPTEQITFIGNIGSGSLTLPQVNDTYYQVFLRMTQNDSKHRGVNSVYDVMGQIKTDATGTQREWAVAMQKELSASLRQFELEVSGQTPGYARCELVSDGTLGALTATGTMLKVTKNTKNAAFYVAATGAASTGDSASGDVISIPSSGGRVFTFTATANAHIVYIGTTAYSVADAGTATQNATAIAAALNAGSQVGAESSTTTVTIWAKPNLPILPPVVWDVTGTAFVAVTTAAGDSTPLRVISGETVTAGADFDTDTLYEGETGYVALGTTGLNQGAIVTATNWGLKIAALREDFSHVTWKDYLKNSFVVHVRKGDADAGVTVTNSVKASSGIGTAELVLGMEYSSMVDNAIGTLPTYIPNEAPEMYASASGRYSLIDISYTNPIDSVIGYGGKTFYHVLFALELDGAANLPSGCQGDQLAETILTTGFTTADLDA